MPLLAVYCKVNIFVEYWSLSDTSFWCSVGRLTMIEGALDEVEGGGSGHSLQIMQILLLLPIALRPF
jgi:hypothetical protein